MSDVDFYDLGNHETASKFLGQKCFGLNIRQAQRLDRCLEAKYLYGLLLADPVQWAGVAHVL
jgi:hypothetical protein